MDEMRYTTWYKAAFYEGEKEGRWNRYDCMEFQAALAEYLYAKAMGVECALVDNWYDLTFDGEEWS